MACLLHLSMPFTLVAGTKVSITSGSFNQGSVWSPAGIPTASDDVIISGGHNITVNGPATVNTITISTAASLGWSGAHTLISNNGINVMGTMDVTGGNVTLSQQGKPFNITNGGKVIWDPADNTANGATLFTNGIENFEPTSSLIIKKWYNYQSVPLKAVITGHFGNLTLNTISGGLLYEWNQKNTFETHLVRGKLTIEQGWVVLDNTGSISHSVFGSIELKNINSYLDFHSGDHPGSFEVEAGSITNIGGTLNGITNGDGNISLHVTGDFINVGYVVLNYNSGTPGKGNGDATLVVDGKFRQPGGDFRGIFNLSTTTAGVSKLTFNDVEITGGQFMGHYACHTAGENSTIHIKGDLTVTLPTTLSRFRGNGLTSLGSISSNNGFGLIIDGECKVSGSTTSEFTTSASAGIENCTFNGKVTLMGCQVSLNYGDHGMVITSQAPFKVNGSQVELSKTSGTMTALFQDSVIIASGTLNLKSGDGTSTIVINGPYLQTGGVLNIYSNDVTAATTPVSFIINGNYTISGGEFCFDKHLTSAISHYCTLAGEIITLSGNAYIKSNNTTGVYGQLQYSRTGIMEYVAMNNTWNLHKVSQSITNACDLQIMQGDLQLASSNSPSAVMLKIYQGGTLDLRDRQVYSNSVLPASSILAEDGSLIRTKRTEGLYNGTASAAIHAGGNLKFQLENASCIEYYGDGPVTITPNGNIPEQQYGILKINLESGNSSAQLSAGNVVVKNTIIAEKGAINLNGNELRVINGKPGSVSTANGMFISEGNGKITIEKPEAGEHGWNFATTSLESLPFSFTPDANSSSYLTASTKPTSSDNFPYPIDPSGNAVTHLVVEGSNASARMLDRWYIVEAPGITADITLSYTESEKTVPGTLINENIAITSWRDQTWTLPKGKGKRPEHSSTAQKLSEWGVLTMIAWPEARKADLLSFSAKRKGKEVDISWTSAAPNDADTYTVERSADGQNFDDIATLPSAGNNSNQGYSTTDRKPYISSSWYRLRQKDRSGSESWSDKVQVSPEGNDQLQVISTNPNPFTNYFEVTCNVPEEGSVTIQILSIKGQQVDAQTYNSTAGRNTFAWQMNKELPEGIYILWISDGIRKTATKIYKQ